MPSLPRPRFRAGRADRASPYCLVSAAPGKAFATPAGRPVLRGFELADSACAMHCLAAPPAAPDRLRLDHAAGLRPGDEVVVTNSMYGGAARGAYQKTVRITGVIHEEITFAPPLPEHMMRYTKALVVIRRGPVRTVTAQHGTLRRERGGGATVTWLYACDDWTCRAEAVVSDEHPRIDVRCTVEFLRPCRLFNLSVVLDSALPLREAYLKNRTIRDLDADPLRGDLWLWKEGCRASDGTAEWTVLHVPGAASCEIVTRGPGVPLKTIDPGRRPVFVVNLEHSHAHHFRRHRERFDANFSSFEERSLPTFVPGDRRTYDFSVHVGPALPPPPRLMLAPGGFRAVNVWTEHADRTTLETHRAAYFGDESITRAEDATGGFVRHGHVVTKSVFCENPKRYPCVSRAGDLLSDSPMVAVAESAGFADLLDQLAALGHEICVHAIRPDRDASDDAAAARAIDGIYGRYGSPTWIDHALESIEFCAGFQGLVPFSGWCMLAAWKRHGVRFFWTWSSADFMPKTRDTIDLLHLDGDGAMPTPLYWRHPALPDGAVIWGANECPLEYFSDEVVDRLIRDRGVSVQQHYYPFLDCDRYDFGFIERGDDGRYRTTERFDRMLAHMARRRDEGELLITTIGALLAHWLALEGIEHTLLPPHGFVLTNTRDEPVPGLSVVVRAAAIASDDVELRQRDLGDGDRLAWFDMPARGRVTFTVRPEGGTTRD